MALIDDRYRQGWVSLVMVKNWGRRRTMDLILMALLNGGFEGE
jgi:hypothetical protein